MWDHTVTLTEIKDCTVDRRDTDRREADRRDRQDRETQMLHCRTLAFNNICQYRRGGILSNSHTAGRRRGERVWEQRRSEEHTSELQSR